jgi:hypothetical protein
VVISYRALTVFTLPDDFVGLSYAPNPNIPHRSLYRIHSLRLREIVSVSVFDTYSFPTTAQESPKL